MWSINIDPLMSLDKAEPPTNSFFCINGSRAQPVFVVSVLPIVPSSPVGSVVPRSMKINKLSQNFDSSINMICLVSLDKPGPLPNNLMVTYNTLPK